MNHLGIFDAVQPYKRALMLHAHAIRRECPFGLVSMSDALKQAWRDLKEWQSMQADRAEWRNSAERLAGINETTKAMRAGSLLARLKEVGKIQSKAIACPSVRNLYPEDMRGMSHIFTRKGGIAIDEAATYLDFPSTCALFEALKQESGKITAAAKVLRAAA